jgi:hypothetical protein
MTELSIRMFLNLAFDLHDLVFRKYPFDDCKSFVGFADKRR